MTKARALILFFASFLFGLAMCAGLTGCAATPAPPPAAPVVPQDPPLARKLWFADADGWVRIRDNVFVSKRVGGHIRIFDGAMRTDILKTLMKHHRMQLLDGWKGEDTGRFGNNYGTSTIYDRERMGRVAVRKISGDYAVVLIGTWDAGHDRDASEQFRRLLFSAMPTD